MKASETQHMIFPGMAEDFEKIPDGVLTEMGEGLRALLKKCGIYYRLFSRLKTAKSMQKKFFKEKYVAGAKVQDLFGLRIVVYFQDDLDILEELISERYSVKRVTADRPDPNTFSPTRLNLICELPDYARKQMPDEIYDRYPIDTTVEIQLRTVFSEGWHEVEHDLRYKASEDWVGNEDLSRALNGIFATLITCDWSIINIFDKLADRKYRDHDWNSVIRSKFRLHLIESPLSEKIVERMNTDQILAAAFYQVDRASVIKFMGEACFEGMQLTPDNLVFLVNALFIHDPVLTRLTPESLQHSIYTCPVSLFPSKKL